jgi:hypothetical protein
LFGAYVWASAEADEVAEFKKCLEEECGARGMRIISYEEIGMLADKLGNETAPPPEAFLEIMECIAHDPGSVAFSTFEEFPADAEA